MTQSNASTGGALKAYVESLGLSIAAYRDVAPQDAKRPHVTIQEGLGLIPDPLEDGAAGTLTEMVQLDLWETWRDEVAGKLVLVESYTLHETLAKKLEGAMLATAPTRVYAVLVRNVIRMVERDNNIVHHAFTLHVRRQF